MDGNLKTSGFSLAALLTRIKCPWAQGPCPYKGPMGQSPWAQGPSAHGPLGPPAPTRSLGPNGPWAQTGPGPNGPGQMGWAGAK